MRCTSCEKSAYNRVIERFDKYGSDIKHDLRQPKKREK
ncbi:unnamed protein product [Brassica rapa]|uniref:Uncharacterized protein n=1 Tax=Brassica campestris TaxID=3711 RepID=A0A8D9ME13_BRACM|nr:unnamed protein product [Brassica rapa]